MDGCVNASVECLEFNRVRPPVGWHGMGLDIMGRTLATGRLCGGYGNLHKQYK